MNGRIGLCTSWLALTLAACSIGRPIPQATTYIIDPPIEPSSASTSRRADMLRIGSVRVAATYAGSALVYRLDDVRYVTDPYHAFAADPGAMLDGRLSEWLARIGPFTHVVASGSTPPAPFVLEVSVEDLYGDFRQATEPAAVMSIRFILINVGGPHQEVAYDRLIERRVPLSRASPDALVRGYGTAVAQILLQLATELRVQL